MRITRNLFSEAVNAIWVLSFDAENQNIMVNTDDLEIVETASNLTQSPNENIRKASSGTLWNLRDELRTSENQKYQEIGMQFTVLYFCYSILRRSGYVYVKQQYLDLSKNTIINCFAMTLELIMFFNLAFWHWSEHSNESYSIGSELPAFLVTRLTFCPNLAVVHIPICVGQYL